MATFGVLELGLVYAGVGSKVTVVEMLPNLLTGADPDLVQVVQRSAQKRLAGILLEAKLGQVERTGDGYSVAIEHKGETKKYKFARVLVAIGRKPNTEDIGLERIAIQLDGRGFIPVDDRLQTAEPGIYAIGDVTAGPMLAHRASAQGKVAAEVIAGHPLPTPSGQPPAIL